MRVCFPVPVFIVTTKSKGNLESSNPESRLPAQTGLLFSRFLVFGKAESFSGILNPVWQIPESGNVHVKSECMSTTILQSISLQDAKYGLREVWRMASTGLREVQSMTSVKYKSKIAHFDFSAKCETRQKYPSRLPYHPSPPPSPHSSIDKQSFTK